MAENKNEKLPLITVGITCYNAAGTIRRAIESAFAQDWPHKEILIVDDYSTDDSVAIIEKIISGKAYAKLIKHRSNRGVGGARRTIVENSSGDFIAFFDDDDESFPGRLGSQYRRIRNYEQETGQSLIACYASGFRIYPNNYKLPLKAIGSQQETPHGPGVADYLLFYRKIPQWFYGAGTPACALMARRHTFESVGNFDPEFRRLEDVDFAIRLALADGYFIGCSEELFTQHSTAAPDKSPEINLKSEQAIALKYRDYLERTGFFSYALIWPRIRYFHYKKKYFKMFLTFLSLGLRHPVKAMKHIIATGPRRLMHERKMRARPV